MAGKHNSAEPSWRPLAQKLSGLIRHSSKSKKLPHDEKSFMSRFKKQEKSPQESAREFKPLEVDIPDRIHLAEGWLEPNELADTSTTPIGDLFASKSVLDVTAVPTQLDTSWKNVNERRPFSMVDNRSIRTSVDVTRDTPAGSILDRGRPIEPTRFVTDPFPQIGSRHDVQPNASAELIAKPRDLSQVSNRGSSIRTEQGVFSQRGGKTLDPSNRHSMYAGITPPLNVVSTISNTAILKTTSAMPLDRIQAWQKSITSAPISTVATGSSTVSALPSAVDIRVRSVSSQGIGNRLAWMRKLEENKSSGTNVDLGVLKKQAGSVSDKLAMFENKQVQSAPPPTRRFPSVARSNSTASRLSWAGLDSNSSAGNITATPRTSIDTVRSNHRASSVMSYYDDSFREKMESIVGGQSTDKDASNLEEKQRVTARFVPVKSEKEEKPLSLETEVSVAIVEARIEEKLQSSQPIESTSTTESDHESDKSKVPLLTTGPIESLKECFSVEKDTDPIIAVETAQNAHASPLDASSSTVESELGVKGETMPQVSQAKKNVLSDKSESAVNPESAEKIESPENPELAEKSQSAENSELAEKSKWAEKVEKVEEPEAENVKEKLEAGSSS